MKTSSRNIHLLLEVKMIIRFKQCNEYSGNSKFLPTVKNYHENIQNAGNKRGREVKRAIERVHYEPQFIDLPFERTDYFSLHTTYAVKLMN